MRWFFKGLDLVFPELERQPHSIKMTVRNVNYQAWLLRLMHFVHNSCSIPVLSGLKYAQAVPVTMYGSGVFRLIYPC